MTVFCYGKVVCSLLILHNDLRNILVTFQCSISAQKFPQRSSILLCFTPLSPFAYTRVKAIFLKDGNNIMSWDECDGWNECHKCPVGPTGATGATGVTGTGISFDCADVTPTILTAVDPTDLIATVAVNVASTSDNVWLTAYVTWTPSAASPTMTFTIVRDDGVVIATASDTPVSANSPITTALVGCDDTPLAGSHSYTLIAAGNGLTGGQTITINQGTLTAADMVS